MLLNDLLNNSYFCNYKFLIYHQHSVPVRIKTALQFTYHTYSQNVHHDSMLPVSIRLYLLASCPPDRPVVYSRLYCAYTQSSTIREDSGFKVFENKVLRKIFRPKSEEGTIDWRK